MAIEDRGAYLRRIVQTPGLTYSYFGSALAGCGASIVFALLPIFAVRELGVGPEQVGLYFTVATLAGIPITLLMGHLSDASSRPRVVSVAVLVWVTFGIALTAVLPSFQVLILVGALILSFIDASNSQMLARGRSLVSKSDTAFATFAGSVLRAGYSLGYVIGPLLAAVILGLASVRIAFVVAALIYIGALLGYAGPTVMRPKGQHKANEAAGASPILLILTCLAFIPVLAAPVARAAYLTLFATESLAIPLSTIVGIIAIAPIAEIGLIPLCGALSARVGAKIVIISGAAVAAVEMLLTGLATQPLHFILLQFLGAFVLACQVSAGMAYLQGLLATRPGLGTSLFFASRAVASAIGAGIGGLIAGAMGYQAVFFSASIFVSCGLVALLLLVRSPARPFSGSGRDDSSSEDEETTRVGL